jgi:hypothetical protein
MAWRSLVDVNLATTSDPGWCLAFAKDAVGAPGGVPTARAAWDNAQDKHWGDTNLPDAVVAVFWSWVGDLGEGPLDYGHVVINVPGRGLFSSPKRWSDGNGSAWYSSIDEVSRWLGATYLGWTSDLNGLQLAVDDGADPAPAPEVASNQRVAGSKGVFRRAEPNQSSEHLTPDLEAGEIGNFVGFVHGEDRGGNDIWFQGVSGNYFWSGAFTNPSTDGLTDLSAPVAQPEPAAATVEHTDVPTVLVPIEQLYPDQTPAPPDPAPEASQPASEPAAEPAPVVEPTPEPAPAEPTPAPETVKEPEVTAPVKPAATDEQIQALIATAKVTEPLDDPNAPVIPDHVAKPLWLVLALVSSSTPYAFGLTVINWGGWDATIATQAAALIVAWSGTLASVLGLSRFSKSTTK